MYLKINIHRSLRPVIGIYICWFCSLFLFAFLSTFTLPNQHNYLGGGEKHYLERPLLWGWSNFDGEHYIAIAREGYKPFEHFFFPGYPLTLRAFAQYINNNQDTYAFMGILISLVAFILATIGLSKLWKLDNPKGNLVELIGLLLLFPTSFYFISVYTESMFLALAVWTFYFARKKQFLYASLCASIAAGTRVIGFALFASLCVEWVLQNKPLKADKLFSYVKSLLPLLLAPLGLFAYMLYLKQTTGDPLIFIHQVGIFGDQRSNTIILLPQVFFRYIVRIFPHLTFYWPVIFTTVLEFLTGVFFLVLFLLGIKKMRLSYLLYFCIGYLVPSFAGSFSSMPRYVLVLFPAFFVWVRLIQHLNRPQKILLYACMFVALGVSTILFIRGYWVS